MKIAESLAITSLKKHTPIDGFSVWIVFFLDFMIVLLIRENVKYPTAVQKVFRISAFFVRLDVPRIFHFSERISPRLTAYQEAPQIRYLFI